MAIMVLLNFWNLYASLTAKHDVGVWFPLLCFLVGCLCIQEFFRYRRKIKALREEIRTLETQL